MNNKVKRMTFYIFRITNNFLMNIVLMAFNDINLILVAQNRNKNN